MKKYVTRKAIVALVRISALGLLAFLIADFSPAFAATLSRGADVRATLSVVWTMIGPFWNARG